jgi:hypothetical protein
LEAGSTFKAEWSFFEVLKSINQGGQYKKTTSKWGINRGGFYNASASVNTLTKADFYKAHLLKC